MGHSENKDIMQLTLYESEVKAAVQYTIIAGGVPLSVVRLCLHRALCQCQIQNNFVIRSKNGEAIIQHKIPCSE